MSDLPHILIVDDSRVVRLSLIQQLQGHYRIREENDGESAWQALVLDKSIKAIISDLQMPRLNGFQLLDRVRTSRLDRLKNIPFVLVSGAETEEERQEALKKGVSDFVTKGTSSKELIASLANLMMLPNAHKNLDQERLMSTDTDEAVETVIVFEREALSNCADRALARYLENSEDVGALVIAFDGYDDLVFRLGTQTVNEISGRFFKMLSDKMRPEDTLGNYAPGQYAVISPGTAPSFCAVFAERVRQAVEVAKLTVRGQKIALTVSVGIAFAALDAKLPTALLDLAAERVQKATQEGGNRVETGIAALLNNKMTVRHALELIDANRKDLLLPSLGALGLEILPLLEVMSTELGLSMPLFDLKRRLSEYEPSK